jgi:VanZ family protein
MYLPDRCSYWLPPLLWMLFISPLNGILTSHNTSSFVMPLITWLLPDAGMHAAETIHIILRKAGHFLEYAFLALLLFRAFSRRGKTFRLNYIFYAGLISLGYSALDEYLQTFIPARTGSFRDWVIDASGVVCALGILAIRNKHKGNNSESGC